MSVSPETAVVILVPPAIVKVSLVLSAVVEPVSPATDAKMFCDEAPPPVSSAGVKLVPFHFKIWFAVGATVVVSRSVIESILDYSVRSFALVSPTPPAVMLMLTYGLSSPSTVKKYPV